ncbi:MAG: hypothetical protein A3E80_02045 [Chlamydiae bacterium RIFCSPHIGHO2_12_FULL_49_9]|nr:MAG: hypothetical protein A3E80_02045 [Chlamydiae bacterium RIFCSPHIGHO2_12_FULL_49_9]
MSIPLVDAGSPPKNLTPPGSAPNSGHPSPRGPASASPELKAKVEALLQKSLPPGDDKVLSQDLREIEAKHSLSELLVAVNEIHAKLVDNAGTIGQLSRIMTIRALASKSIAP